MKQTSFFKNEKSDFGGSLAKGKRKLHRPLSLKKPMHIVIKSSKAQGSLAFSPTDRKLIYLIQQMAKRFRIRIYSKALNWSHLHLLVKLSSRPAYCGFIRALTGALVKSRKAEKGFFDLLPFTKIGSWGKQFQILKDYCEQNDFQARGFSSKMKDVINKSRNKRNFNSESS